MHMVCVVLVKSIPSLLQMPTLSLLPFFPVYGKKQSKKRTFWLMFPKESIQKWHILEIQIIWKKKKANQNKQPNKQQQKQQKRGWFLCIQRSKVEPLIMSTKEPLIHAMNPYFMHFIWTVLISLTSRWLILETFGCHCSCLSGPWAAFLLTSLGILSPNQSSPMPLWPFSTMHSGGWTSQSSDVHVCCSDPMEVTAWTQRILICSYRPYSSPTGPNDILRIPKTSSEQVRWLRRQRSLEPSPTF